MFLCFSQGSRSVAATRLASADVAGACGASRLALLVGADQVGAEGDELVAVIAHAVGLTGRSGADAVRARLVARGESDLTCLLDLGSEGPELDEILELLNLAQTPPVRSRSND
jgi:hypothetical protein